MHFVINLIELLKFEESY